VDGVLIDVQETFWRSALQTMEKLTGKKATWAELHKWKRQPGNNDDWMMVSQWATASGVPTTYEEAREAFQPFYWGSNGKPGNVAKEKWLVTPKLVKVGEAAGVELLRGERGRNLRIRSSGGPPRNISTRWLTMDDARKKPHPDGLLAILGKRESEIGIVSWRPTSMMHCRPRRRACRSWRFCQRIRTISGNARRNFES